LIFSWVGNPGVGSLHRFRDAYENGWPAPIAIEEHSHAAMANAYEAGAAGAPVAGVRRYIGGDLAKVTRNIRHVTCPFTGERLAAVPAIRPDVAVIHALKADRAGNVLIEGIVGVQKEAALAAKRSLVTVEEIVEDFGERSANAVILPNWSVGAIACVPGGAHPSYAHGYYKRDNAYYKAWDAISRDRDAFLAWMKTNVLEQGPEAFAVHCSRPLAARRTLHRWLPRRCADRSLRQPQHHGGWVLRPAENAASRRRRRARDLQRLRRDFHHHAPVAAQLRRDARLRHLVRPRRRRRPSRAHGACDQGPDQARHRSRHLRARSRHQGDDGHLDPSGDDARRDQGQYRLARALCRRCDRDARADRAGIVRVAGVARAHRARTRRRGVRSAV